jgi:uncharacterized protein YraI
MRPILILAALVAAAVPLAPAAAQTMRGYTTGSTRLYSGPLRDYPSVRYIRGGAMVSVHGCLRDWTWCDVTYRADRGWIAGNALRMRQNGRRRGVGDGMGIGVTSFLFGTYWENNYQGRRFYGERQRWQSQYDSAYRPEWGAREQRRDEGTGSTRGQIRDRRGSEGQHGQDLRGSNRQAGDQQRMQWQAGPGRGATNNNGGRTRPDRSHDQRPDQGDNAGHPHN